MKYIQNKSRIDDYENRNTNRDTNTKEDFCGACVGGAMALSGGVIAGYTGSNKRGSHKKQKKYILWLSIVFSIIGVLITIYYLYIRKCLECR